MPQRQITIADDTSESSSAEAIASQQTIEWEKDNSAMVLIPEGPLTSRFYMDKYEVTNAQYRKFVRDTGHREPRFWGDDDRAKYNQPNQPVVCVSWDDAVSYAKWAGKRLPTEKEWEWAARGGLEDKRYSWGDDESVARDYANYDGTDGKDSWGRLAAPVGSFKPNGYGLYDIGGNVYEWCEDWYRSEKVLRGGSWDDSIDNLRVANRHSVDPTKRLNDRGFRCAADVDTTTDYFNLNKSESLQPSTNQSNINWKKDNSQMVLIPAGSFEMGDVMNEPDDLMKHSKPIHKVELDAFYMDVHEVTVGQFRAFVNQSGYSYDKWNSVIKYSPEDRYPMGLVSWNDAMAYAKWVGKRLPTEAEWEYAARGGLSSKRYPWGDEINHDDANYRGTGGKDKWEYCSPIGSFEANGYGLYDMVGNVFEWCQDWYDEGYYGVSPTKNPLGAETGVDKVFRGGSWCFGPNFLRVAHRSNDNPINSDHLLALGFGVLWV